MQQVKTELEILYGVYQQCKTLRNYLDDETYNIVNDNLDQLYKFLVEFNKDLAFDIRVLKATQEVE
jgi:flagellin-specific chaperone FliS